MLRLGGLNTMKIKGREVVDKEMNSLSCTLPLIKKAKQSDYPSFLEGYIGFGLRGCSIF
jgi:hypothetical protein